MIEAKDHPYEEIAARLIWHRTEVLQLTQAQYAERIGVKRARLSLWETGDHRLSLDGALRIRDKYNVSLDFIFAGNDDALPQSLRNAWRDRPSDKS